MDPIMGVFRRLKFYGAEEFHPAHALRVCLKYLQSLIVDLLPVKFHGVQFPQILPHHRCQRNLTPLTHELQYINNLWDL